MHARGSSCPFQHGPDQPPHLSVPQPQLCGRKLRKGKKKAMTSHEWFGAMSASVGVGCRNFWQPFPTSCLAVGWSLHFLPLCFTKEFAHGRSVFLNKEEEVSAAVPSLRASWSYNPCPSPSSNPCLKTDKKTVQNSSLQGNPKLNLNTLTSSSGLRMAWFVETVFEGGKRLGTWLWECGPILTELHALDGWTRVIFLFIFLHCLIFFLFLCVCKK